MAPKKPEIADDTAQQQAGLRILNALHREGFTNCWLDSVLLFSGGLAERTEAGVPPQVRHHHLRVIVQDNELGHDQMAKILAVAAAHDGRVALANIRMDGQDFSRIAIWPR